MDIEERKMSKEELPPVVKEIKELPRAGTVLRSIKANDLPTELRRPLKRVFELDSKRRKVSAGTVKAIEAAYLMYVSRTLSDYEFQNTTHVAFDGNQLHLIKARQKLWGRVFAPLFKPSRVPVRYTD